MKKKKMKVIIEFLKAGERDMQLALDEQRATIERLIQEKNAMAKVIIEFQNEYVKKQLRKKK